MPDVFISYKHRLRDRVNDVATALRALGLDVWFDEGLTSGDDYAGAISEQLRAAKCVMVAWSPDVFPPADKHGWVRGEAQKGRERDVLVAVMLEPTDLDPPWNTVQYENLVEWTADTADRTNWRRTLRAIGGLVGRPGLAEFDRAQAAGTASALTDWAREFSEDPLVPAVWQKIEELEVAATRERLRAEREREKPEVVAAAFKIETPAPKPPPRRAPEPEPARVETAVERTPTPVPEAGPVVASGLRVWPLAAATAFAVIASIMAAIALGALGLSSTGGLIILAGPLLLAGVHAVALWLMRLLKPWPAVGFAVAGIVGYGLAILLMFTVSMSLRYDARLLSEVAAGVAFAGLPMLGSLGALALLARPRPAGAVAKIAIVTMGSVIVVGLGASLPGFSITRPEPGFVALVALWQVGYALAVLWLFRAPQARSAKTM